MKNNIIKAHLALLGANIIYGANHLIAKGVMPNKIGPSAFVFLRIVGAGILFWIIKSLVAIPRFFSFSAFRRILKN